MKFILHRDPDNKIQKIPYAVLQVSALADAEELTVQTGDGCVLLCRNVLTTREAVGTIAHLYEAIEEAVRKHFDGSYLDNDCLDGVLREFGYKRTAWVLSNTIQQMDWDGRFSPRNKAWAKQTYIPQDKRHSLDFVVNSHPAVLDGVVDQYRSAYQALGLFGPAQCEPDSYSSLDYEGKVLVLSPDTLKESYWNTRAQLWYAHDGSGCSPRAVGRSIRCTCLGDGEMTRWNRTDFIGVLSPDYLPNWAREKLTQLGVENIPLNRTELEKSLSRKIESGWDDFTRDILSLSPKEIMERAEDIAAARFCRDEMTENIMLYSRAELEFLNSLPQPLEVLRDQWLSEQNADHKDEMSHAIWTLEEEFRQEIEAAPDKACDMTME